MKAGFYGSLDEIKDTIKLTRYQAIKVEMSYDEYLEMKKLLLFYLYFFVYFFFSLF
jgi:hypothetical protein